MDDKIEKTIDIAAPVSRVWRALTDHKEFGQWFRVALNGPFEVGKIVQGELLMPGYEKLKWEALIERLEPQTLFSFSWHPYAIEPDTDYSHEPRTVIVFELEPIPSGTRLTIVESGFSKLPDARRIEAFRMNTEGWDFQAENVAAHAAD